jgi:hypothetical protein
MKHLFIFFLLLLIGAGCKQNPPAPAADHASASFREFLKKFKPTSLPFRLRPSEELSVDGLAELSGATSDTLFIHTEEDINYAFVMLPDTSRVYQLVWLAPADTYQAFLSTFSKSGVKISEAHIGIGGCGADCGFECSETVLIGKDMSIYAVDTISSAECDDNGNVIDGTMKRYLRYTTGKVEADGKIMMSEEMEKEWGKK